MFERIHPSRGVKRATSLGVFARDGLGVHLVALVALVAPSGPVDDASAREDAEDESAIASSVDRARERARDDAMTRRIGADARARGWRQSLTSRRSTTDERASERGRYARAR